MSKIIIITFVILFVCCKNETTYKVAIDQKLRRELFCECLKTVPQTPEVMGKSDWSKIVNECSDYAISLSQRAVPQDSIVRCGSYLIVK